MLQHVHCPFFGQGGLAEPAPGKPIDQRQVSCYLLFIVDHCPNRIPVGKKGENKKLSFSYDSAGKEKKTGQKKKTRDKNVCHVRQPE
jgi:hypothetical protein